MVPRKSARTPPPRAMARVQLVHEEMWGDTWGDIRAMARAQLG